MISKFSLKTTEHGCTLDSGQALEVAPSLSSSLIWCLMGKREGEVEAFPRYWKAWSHPGPARMLINHDEWVGWRYTARGLRQEAEVELVPPVDSSAELGREGTLLEKREEGTTEKKKKRRGQEGSGVRKPAATTHPQARHGSATDLILESESDRPLGMNTSQVYTRGRSHSGQTLQSVTQDQHIVSPELSLKQKRKANISLRHCASQSWSFV